MNTVFVAATATLVAAATIMTSTVPANAGRFHARAHARAHIGHHLYVAPPVVVRRPIVVAPPVYVAPRVYVAPAPVYVAPGDNWAAHVNYCSGKYASYDVTTNTYVSNSGYVKTCNSPYT
jgi:hypothetical protein